MAALVFAPDGIERFADALTTLVRRRHAAPYVA
jgi:hypothetical protein